MRTFDHECAQERPRRLNAVSLVQVGMRGVRGQVSLP